MDSELEIKIVPYDATWENQYMAEAIKLKSIFEDIIINTYHIGSTAVPGLAAKPTIDILIVVSNLESVDEKNPEMIRLNYHPMGENGIPERRIFWKGTEKIHTYNVHVLQLGNPRIERYLRLRDYLRIHPDKAEQYAEIKRKAALKHPHNNISYNIAKEPMIFKLEQEAEIWFKKNQPRDQN